jgi:glycosyltransferase involved in cell wall biosynthesis
VLHDFVMQGFYAEQYDETGDYLRYARLQEQFYGEQGRKIAERIKVRSSVPIWEAPDAIQFPLNEEIVSHARGLIVHSDFVRERIQALTSVPVFTIPHHGHVVKSFDDSAIRRNLGVEESQLLICSAGYISKNKRYDQILAALQQLEDISFQYVIAGEDRGGLLRDPLRSKDMSFRVLGHLLLPEMESILSASDICINLRFPTMGESSGSLIRMMGYGKPVLVTNFGSYAELPDYAVLKVDPDIDEVETIKRFVHSLALDPDFRISVGREARAFVERECSLPRCAELYTQAIRHCCRSTRGDPGEKGN